MTTRRINFTGRTRITRDRVCFRIADPRPGEPLRAEPKINLRDLGFPEDALIVVEAYTRSTGQRFGFGTVGNPSVPDQLVLSEVDRDAAVTFRLRVVDMGERRGRVLGAAEKIRALSGEEEEQPRGRSLLPIDSRDLGEELWRVEIGDAGPVLLLNTAGIPGLRDRLRSDPLLQALILPAALRAILRELISDPSGGGDEQDADGDWKEDWLRFCRETLRIKADPSRLGGDGRRQWVDDVVDAFCMNHRFVLSVRRLIGGEGIDAVAS